MDPFSQELRLRESGVQRDKVHRDIGVSGATGTDQRHGWRRLDGRLSGGDTLVVVRIDRIGRRWLDTLQCIIARRARRVKIRSLDETEGWTQFLELEPDDPMAFVGHQMVSMAVWVADQERDVAHRRTREGLAAARARGKTLGTAALPHRRPGADGQADEGRRSIGSEDRAAPGGQRKDGAQRPEGGTVNIDVTADCANQIRGTGTSGNMTNRNLLLGRSRPREKLTREEIAALDRVTSSPAPPAKKGGGPQRMVRRDLLKLHWSLECPGCGFKVTGDGQPQPGQRLARCGRCQLVLGGG